MRKWYPRIGILLLLAAAVYLYFNWSSVRPLLGFSTGVQGSKKSKASSFFGINKDKLDWQLFNNADGAYQVEIPASVIAGTVPAYAMDGTTEPVHMQTAHIDGNVAFAIAWADNPPITRISHTSVDNTLDMARDGAMDRTHTKLIAETKLTVQGYPARDFQSSTSSGTAFLYGRFVYAGQRLYMLMVIYPSAETLHEQDTARFFNSFKLNQSSATPTDASSTGRESQLPESVPAAQVPTGQGQ